MKAWASFLLLPCALWAAGCGHATRVRPTPPGQFALEGTLGGPFAKVGSNVLPIPLTTVGGSYGLSEVADVHAHLHGTSLAFGVAGADVGGSYLVLKERGAIPAVNLTTRLYGFTDLQGFAPYLELTGAGSYLLADRFLAYLSVSTLVQTDGLPLFSVAAGNEFQLGAFGVQLEWRWYQPDYQTRFTVVNWQSVGDQGAWGALVSMRYRFGEPKESSR